MARLDNQELENIKNKYQVSVIWSWSRVNCFMNSQYEYFLKYILHKAEDRQDCCYTTLGSLAHEILDNFYEKKIAFKEMIDNFEDGWTTSIDICDLKFDRNDKDKNNSIKNKYKEDLEHFFKNHTIYKHKLEIEKPIIINVKGNIFVGYIDAMFKDDNDIYNIIDFKTSTKYSGNMAEEKAGQLVLYALGLSQMYNIPLNKIKINFNFLKYVSIQYQQKNGAVKTREVERCKIGESLQANAKMWLKAGGYDVDEYLKLMLDTNGIECLPQDIQDKYVISDCYVYVPLTEKLIDKWTTEIITTLKDIELREEDYRETENDKVFWDTEESVKAQSYYFSTLCAYSPNLHLPYKAYLDKLEAAKNGEDTFGGIGTECNDTEILQKDKTNKGKHQNTEEVDLSWLDEL